jgi:SAM-dependent methyltransferase
MTQTTYSRFIRIAAVLSHHRHAWRTIYRCIKHQFLRQILSDPHITSIFRQGDPLPGSFGLGIDERCVEYPWFFANASPAALTYLDAGSIFNSRLLLQHSFWKGRQLTILTLSPEANCFWRLGVSYQYGDLRRSPFRDGCFDEIACLSTLEHVGMDNSYYVHRPTHENLRVHDFLYALSEIRRILKPGGRLLLSVPYGVYRNYGTFQQFDAHLVSAAMDAFRPCVECIRYYRYTPAGWQIATSAEGADAHYSEYTLGHWMPDYRKERLSLDLAAGARAVACCIWQKPKSNTCS